jgi:uncharacterized protein YtpQ (UPF0354 family)
MGTWNSLFVSAVRLFRRPDDTVLSKTRFTEAFAAELRGAFPNHRIEISGDMHVVVRGPDGKQQVAFLDNCYAEYLQDPKLRDELFGRHMSSLRANAQLKDEIDPAQIVPIIKDRAWLEEVRIGMKVRGAEGPSDYIYDALNNELVIVYAEDNPTAIRYLTAENLASAGVPRERLHELAILNLRRLLPEIKLHGSGGTYMLTAGGNYEACLVLLEDIWNERKLDVQGDYVVALPSRDMLLITGSENAEGLRKLRELAAKMIQEAAYRLTADLFVYRDGRFRKLEQADT